MLYRVQDEPHGAGPTRPNNRRSQGMPVLKIAPLFSGQNPPSSWRPCIGIVERVLVTGWIRSRRQAIEVTQATAPKLTWTAPTSWLGLRRRPRPVLLRQRHHLSGWGAEGPRAHSGNQILHLRYVPGDISWILYPMRSHTATRPTTFSNHQIECS